MLMKSSFFTVSFFKSLLISIILAVTIIPVILLLTTANTSWMLMVILLWTIGSLAVFHPFLLHIYPHLLTKTSVYILTSILILVSTWLNIMLVSFILPYDYLYYAFFNTTIKEIALWGSGYLIFIDAIITNLIIMSQIEFYTEERLF